MKKSIYSLLIGMALFTTLLLTACFAVPAQDMEEYGSQMSTLSAGSVMTERLMAYISFEEAIQSADTIVLVEYVTHRPFGQALTEFEFIVHERIFGTAADRIFVYIERDLSRVEEVRTISGHEMPSFNTGAQYILLLYKLTTPHLNTHEDGFQFFHNVIIDLNNLGESTMFGAPLAAQVTGINFNARNLTGDYIMGYMAELSRNNTPARDFIRSDVLEDIVLGSRHVVVVDISSIFSLSSDQWSQDWMSRDIYYLTIVQALKGDMMPGQQIRQVFFADTVQLGERHLIAIEPRSEPEPFFHMLSSRHSLLRMDQLDEVAEILGRAPPDLDPPDSGRYTITFHKYDGSGDYEVVRVNPGSRLNPATLRALGIAVDHIPAQPNLPGAALWGWFTDEALNSSGRSRNGLRRPTVGEKGFGLDVVITQAMIDELFTAGNLDLYAIWARWGDVNDDAAFTSVDFDLFARHIRRLYPRQDINFIPADVLHDGSVNLVDLDVFIRHIRLLFPRHPLGAVPSALPIVSPLARANQFAASEPLQAADNRVVWNISREEVLSSAQHVFVRVYMSQAASVGTNSAMFNISYDPTVLANPTLAADERYFDLSLLTPAQRAQFDLLAGMLPRHDVKNLSQFAHAWVGISRSNFGQLRLDAQHQAQQRPAVHGHGDNTINLFWSQGHYAGLMYIYLRFDVVAPAAVGAVGNINFTGTVDIVGSGSTLITDVTSNNGSVSIIG